MGAELTTSMLCPHSQSSPLLHTGCPCGPQSGQVLGPSPATCPFPATEVPPACFRATLVNFSFQEKHSASRSTWGPSVLLQACLYRPLQKEFLVLLAGGRVGWWRSLWASMLPRPHLRSEARSRCVGSPNSAQAQASFLQPSHLTPGLSSAWGLSNHHTRLCACCLCHAC